MFQVIEHIDSQPIVRGEFANLHDAAALADEGNEANARVGYAANWSVWYEGERWQRA